MTRPGLRTILTVLGSLLALAAALVLLRGTDPLEVRALVANLGPRALLVPLPFLVSASLDAWSWRLLLSRFGRQVPVYRLLPIRLAGEALALTAPAGSLLADSLAPHWLLQRCQVPLDEGIASTAARKVLVVVAHALFLVLATLVAALGAAQGAWPAALALGVAGAFLLTAALGARLLATGRACTAVHAGLVRLPRAAWRQRLQQLQPAFAAVDRRLLQVVRGGPWPLVVALLALTAAYVVDAFEAYLILNLLGAPIPFVLLLPAEALIQLVRVALMVVPAGLGVQEAGYLMFIRAALSVEATPLAAAFLLVKRLKDALYAVVGYALMVVPRGMETPAVLAGQREWQIP